MNASLIKNGILVFLVEFLSIFKFNLGGEISISEMFLILWFVFSFSKLKGVVYWNRFFRLYKYLFLAQLFSEIFVSNGLNDSLRGLMVTVVSFIHLSFLLYFSSKNNKTLLFAFIGLSLSILLSKNSEEVSLEAIEGGEAAAYVKMRIAPAVGYLLMVASTFFNKRINIFMFVIVGATLVVLGARSGGMFVVVSGIFGYYLASGKKINIRNKIPSILIAVVFLYIIYVFYVDAVLGGQIISGNNHQIFTMKNPYNPLELLFVGRTEFFIGIQAFIDRFWLGFGAWAKDTTGHYWDLMHEIKKTDSTYHGTWLPVHSVLMGWGVYNGVLSFIAGAKIVSFTLKNSLQSFKYNLYDNKYMSCVVYCLASFIWNLLFSPPSHFRYTLPVMMVGILTFIKESYDR